jgi:hypothetical protein
MIVTKFGAERVTSEGFSELVGTLLATTDFDDVRLFIGVVLCSDAVGHTIGSMADFRNFMITYADDIHNCLPASAARC